MPSSTYGVKVAGTIPEKDLAELGAIGVTSQSARTVLYGQIPDQAALHGLLARLRAMGLDVVEVRQVLAPESSEPT